MSVEGGEARNLVSFIVDLHLQNACGSLWHVSVDNLPEERHLPCLVVLDETPEFSYQWGRRWLHLEVIGGSDCLVGELDSDDDELH